MTVYTVCLDEGIEGISCRVFSTEAKREAWLESFATDLAGARGETFRCDAEEYLEALHEDGAIEFYLETVRVDID